MLGGGQIVVRKQLATAFDVREAAARLALREAHKQGHAYVELREAGGKKRASVFFCTLCLKQCFSDSALWDHLHGGRHARKLATAKPTLFGPHPWPFRDGVLFFGGEDSPERMASPRTPLQAPIPLACIRALGCSDHEAPLKIRGVDEDSDDSPESDCESVKTVCKEKMNRWSLRPVKVKGGGGKKNGADGVLICKDNLVIRDILIGEKVSQLKIRSIGLGHISCSTLRREQAEAGADGRGVSCRIWCAWLGEGEAGDKEVLSMAQDCEFAIVNFPYTLELGRRGNACDLDLFSLEGGEEEGESEGDGEEEVNNSSCSRKKQKKFVSSDPEDNSTRQDELGGISSPEHSVGSNGSASTALSKSTRDSRIHPRRLLSSKAIRQEMRRKERLAAERTCGICRQKMLPGKDVAALLNLRTGKMSCSSRNTNGAFHVFHISCLIQWILLCEFEVWSHGKTGRTRGGGRGRKGKRAAKRQISSVFCPECQGTGVHVKGDQLEHPTIPLSEVFHYELKSIQARKSWMENPEPLKTCSTGLYLPCEESLEEKTPPSKLLHFFRAE